MELAELRAALKGAMIETRYQPIVGIADRSPIGLEALVRLNHPEQGTLAPDLFVPQIEHAGLAAELTGLVSARAFGDLRGPSLAGRGLRMSVNFPLDVLLMPAALDRLEEQREAAGVAASCIIIELTESRPVNDIPILRRSLERLRMLGYGAAIDDVGPAVAGEVGQHPEVVVGPPALVDAEADAPDNAASERPRNQRSGLSTCQSKVRGNQVEHEAEDEQIEAVHRVA